MEEVGFGNAGKKDRGIGMGRNLSRKESTNEHEKQIAKKLGGRVQPNSGAIAAYKGDISLDRFLLESKETASKHLKVAASDLVKICREAGEVRKYPGLVLTLETDSVTIPREWVAVPLDVFSAMLAQGMGDLE